jgi:hypothetical protein
MKSSTQLLKKTNDDSRLHFDRYIFKKFAELGSAFRHGWRTLLNSFETRNEPRIWATRDRHGHQYWHVFDPMTERSWTLSSEEEVRIYLEERYNY